MLRLDALDRFGRPRRVDPTGPRGRKHVGVGEVVAPRADLPARSHAHDHAHRWQASEVRFLLLAAETGKRDDVAAATELTERVLRNRRLLA